MHMELFRIVASSLPHTLPPTLLLSMNARDSLPGSSR
jgi:hypothetical protein